MEAVLSSKLPVVRVLLLLCKNPGLGIFLSSYKLLTPVCPFYDGSTLLEIYMENVSIFYRKH